MTPGRDVAQLLELSDERDLWLRRIIAAEITGFDRGRGVGYTEGRQAEAAERDRAWNVIARPASRAVPLTELERRRWRLRGEPRDRASFAQPHPGDYAGGRT